MAKALLLNRSEIERLVEPDRLLDVLAAGFKVLSADPRAAVPPRGNLAIGSAGHLLTMPAAAPGLPVSVKLVTVFPGNGALGLSSHLGLIVLLDAATGAVLALMDGEHITAMRTAGAAALAATMLARLDARVMTILGAGVQGKAHLDLMTRHFALEAILVGSRSRASAEKLASADRRVTVIDDPEAAVRRSDIVCLCSHAAQPLILKDWIRPGQHISSVGFAPPGGELDPAIAAAGKLYVESRIAFSPPPAGCAELAGIDPASACELGELLLGMRPGRETADEVTVYKAMGHGIEDLMVADMVYRAAIAQSAGQWIEL